MKKKSLLLITIFSAFLCACGGKEASDRKEDPADISSITIEEMKEYYDSDEFPGTPYLGVARAQQEKLLGHWVLSVFNKETYPTDGESTDNHIFIDGDYVSDFEMERRGVYDCILTDNNTPDTDADDELVYIFSTNKASEYNTDQVEE